MAEDRLHKRCLSRLAQDCLIVAGSVFLRQCTPALYNMSAADEEDIKAALYDFAEYEITTTPAAYKNQLQLATDG